MNNPDITKPLTDREKLIVELAVTATIRMINQGGPDAWRDSSVGEIRSDAEAEIVQLLAHIGGETDTGTR